LALTGDFVSRPFFGGNGPRGARHAEPCAEVLSKVTGIPVLAVLGNHDHWNSARIVEGALLDRGIKVLRNDAVPLERDSQRIWISGVDDALVRTANLSQALRNVPPVGSDYLAGPRARLRRLRREFPG
jgi:predicted MPP superfamily phosphohydrolase